MAHLDILIFAPSPSGGLAEHAFYQARALHRAGAHILCLASRRFVGGRACEFPVERGLGVPPPASGNALIRRFAQVFAAVGNQLRLAWWILKLRPRLVLLESYVEYLSPLWIWPHVLLADLGGVKYVANLHDPVRDYRLGPQWWHDLSVLLAYTPLHAVLVHDTLPSPSPVPAHPRVVQVPVGVYDLPGPHRSRAEVRAAWGAQPHHRVFLAFGYVRNGKNLDLAIEALAAVPDAFVVIAGSVAAGHDRPFAFYRDLAARLGVADRVVLREGFVADSDLADYFLGTDFILLTYSAAFRSQSGVLNLAARARKSVLASAAPSPLLTAVQTHGLGVTIEPDTGVTVVQGMLQLLQAPPTARWDDYHRHASWESNARGILTLLSTSTRP